jgi:hypothetical protein
MYRTSKVLDLLFNFSITILLIILPQFFIYPLIQENYGDVYFGNFLIYTGIILVLYTPYNTAISNSFLRNNGNFISLNIKSYIYGLAIYVMFITPILWFLFNSYELYVWGGFLGLRISSTAPIRRDTRFDYMFFTYILSFSLSIILLYSSGELINPIWSLVFFEFILCVSNLFYIYKNKLFKNLIHSDGGFFDFMTMINLGVTSNLVTYYDRFVLQIFSMTSMISEFYIISLMPKLLVTFSTTINGVILSHLSKEEKLDKINFFKHLIPVVVILFVGVIFIDLFAPFVVRYIYPNFIWSEYNKKILYLSSLAFTLLSVEKLIKGAILKFSKNKNLLKFDYISLFSHILILFLCFSLYTSLLSLAIALVLSFSFKLVLAILQIKKI